MRLVPRLVIDVSKIESENNSHQAGFLRPNPSTKTPRISLRPNASTKTPRIFPRPNPSTKSKPLNSRVCTLFAYSPHCRDFNIFILSHTVPYTHPLLFAILHHCAMPSSMHVHVNMNMQHSYGRVSVSPRVSVSSSSLYSLRARRNLLLSSKREGELAKNEKHILDTLRNRFSIKDLSRGREEVSAALSILGKGSWNSISEELGAPEIRHFTENIDICVWRFVDSSNSLLVGVRTEAIGWKMAAIRIFSPLGEVAAQYGLPPAAELRMESHKQIYFTSVSAWAGGRVEIYFSSNHHRYK